MAKTKSRGNGEGSIFKQKIKRQSGKEYVIWVAQISQNNGKIKRIYGKTRNEVSEKLKGELAKQQKGLSVDSSKITTEEYIPIFLATKKDEVKTTTYESYVQTFDNHIIPAFGDVKLQKIDLEEVNGFIDQLKSSGKAAGTIARIKNVFHCLLQSAVNNDLMVVNPVSRAKTIKKNMPEMNVLTPEQIRTLLDKAKEVYALKGNSHKYLYHAVLLALATGLRRGELLALTWDNVHIENNTISVKQNLVEVHGGIQFETPKTASSIRTIAVSADIMEKLQQYKKPGKCQYVFHTSSNKPITPSNLSRSFRWLLAQCNIENIRFHDLRHTHATQLLSNGVNIKQVSVRLGHEDIRITLQTYIHFLPQQDREAAEIMGSFLV